MESLKANRQFLKADRWGEWRDSETDQKKRVPVPPAQKPCPEGAVPLNLPPPEEITVGRMPLFDAIAQRRSRRRFTKEPLTLEELSFLLWATQGVSQVMTQKDGSIVRTLRTVPSGGARHPFETYLLVNRVEELEPGLYKYQALGHTLCLLRSEPELTDLVHDATNGQYVRESAVTFIWTAIPYRTEWRYSIVSAKIIAQDSGHLCQNLYLASEAIGGGTCAIGAYDQAKIDPILGVDGEEEFTIYIAPVGKVELN